MKDLQANSDRDLGSQATRDPTLPLQTSGLGEVAERSSESKSKVKSESEGGADRKNNGVLEQTSPPRKPRRQKPSSFEFLEHARQAVSAIPSQTGLRLLQKLLKAGVSAQSSLEPLTDDLFHLLKDWPECSHLALQLSVQTRLRPPTALVRSLRNRLIAHSRYMVGYPESAESIADQDQLSDTVSAWLQNYLNSTPNPKEDREKHVPDLNRARWAAVCLMEQPLIVRVEGIYRLLEALAIVDLASDGGEAEALFFHEVGSLLDGGKLNASRMTFGLKLAAGARSLGKATLGQFKLARKTIEDQNTQLEELRDRINRLGNSLADTKTQITEMEAALHQKTQEIEQQKVERDLDKEHWEALAKQQLAKKVNTISEELSHEVAEAKICLAEDALNIRMALNRLRQMEKALTKMRGG